MDTVRIRSGFKLFSGGKQLENGLKTVENGLKPVMHVNSGENCRFANSYRFENSYENSYRFKSVMNPDNCKFRQSVIRIQFENSYADRKQLFVSN